MLDCYIPVIPSVPNFDEMVPVREVSKALKHLGIPDSIFWDGIPDESIESVAVPIVRGVSEQ